VAESEGAERVCRDGLKAGGEASGPVAENRDVQTHHMSRRRPREAFTPRSPTRSSPSWRPAAMGDGDQGVARHAAQRCHATGIFRDLLILWGAVIEHGFSGQSWLTFRQALGLGGHVRN
jgi:N-terminal domain of anti-restriction factor ArdC